MSESRTPASPVLGQASVQRQPRLLRRPSVAAKGAPLVSLEPPVVTAITTADTLASRSDGWHAGEAAGREEGLRRGSEEGRRQGFEKGAEEGRKEGYEEGLRQGLELARERTEAETAALNAAWRQREAQLLQLLQAIPAQLQQHIAGMEDDMVALSHAALLRILGPACQSELGTRLIVRQQLEEFGQRQVVTVRVHPDDARVLSKEAQFSEPDGQNITWQADPRVVLGGCILDSAEGGIDARLETQLRAFTDMLSRTRQRGVAETSATAATDTRAETP